MAFRHIKEIYAPLSELKFGRRVKRDYDNANGLIVAEVGVGSFIYLNREGILCNKDGDVETNKTSGTPKIEDFDEKTKNRILLKPRQVAICTIDFEDLLDKDTFEDGATYTPEKDQNALIVYRDENNVFRYLMDSGDYVKKDLDGNVTIDGDLFVGDAGKDVGVITALKSFNIGPKSEGNIVIAYDKNNKSASLTGTSFNVKGEGEVIGSSKSINGSTITGTSTIKGQSYQVSDSTPVINSGGKFVGPGVEIGTAAVKGVLNSAGATITNDDVKGVFDSTGIDISDGVDAPNTKTAKINLNTLKLMGAGASIEVGVKDGNDGSIKINGLNVLKEGDGLNEKVAQLNVGEYELKDIGALVQGDIVLKQLRLVNDALDDQKTIHFGSTFTARAPEEAAIFRKSETPEYPQWSIKGESDGTEHTLEFDYLYKKDPSKGDVTRDPITRFSKDNVLFQRSLEITDSTNTDNLSVKTNSIVLEDVADTEPGRTQWKLQANQKNELYEQRKIVVDFITDAKKLAGLVLEGASAAILSIGSGGFDSDNNIPNTPITTYSQSNWAAIVSSFLSYESSNADILIGKGTDSQGGVLINPFGSASYLSGALYEAKHATEIGTSATDGSLFLALQKAEQALKILKAITPTIASAFLGDVTHYVENVPTLPGSSSNDDSYTANSFTLLQDEDSTGESSRQVAEFSVDYDNAGTGLTTYQLDITGRDSYSHSTGKVRTNTLELEDDRDGNATKNKWAIASKQGTAFDIWKRKVISVAEEVSALASFFKSEVEKVTPPENQVPAQQKVFINYPKDSPEVIDKTPFDWVDICVAIAGKKSNLSNMGNPLDNGISDDKNITGALYDALNAQKLGLIDDDYNSAPLEDNRQTLWGAITEVLNAITLIESISSQMVGADYYKDVDPNKWNFISTQAGTLNLKISGIKSKLTTAQSAIGDHVEDSNRLSVKIDDYEVADFQKVTVTPDVGDPFSKGTFNSNVICAKNELKAEGCISFTEQSGEPESINSLFVKNGQLVFKDAAGKMYEVSLGAEITP